MASTALVPYISGDTNNLATYIINAVNALPADYTFSKQDFINILSDFSDSNQEIFLQLSQTHPDFESIKQQLNTELQNTDAWRDIIQASGGGTVVDFLASIAVYNTDAVAVALQETNLDTAGLDSSIYVIMRMLGVHLTRKRPAQIPVTLTSNLTSTVAIPSFTQFSVNNIDYFNRTALVLNPNNGPLDCLLYQGTLRTVAITSTGSPFQRFETGKSDYSISDTDLYCFQPDGTTWLKVNDGLFKYSSTDQVFYENTTPEGNIEVLFGNNLYGAIPAPNTILAFVYVETLGSLGNGAGLGSLVTPVSFNNYVPDRITLGNIGDTQAYQAALLAGITGTATGNAVNGEDQYDKEYYRAVGPYLGTGKKGAVRKPEVYARALQFPGVADILIRNQKDVAPYNRNLINVVTVTPLMKSGQLMSNAQWSDFIDYMDSFTIWRQEWMLVQSNPRPIDIKGTLYVSPNSDISNIVPYAEFNIRKNIGIRRGALGQSIGLDNISQFLKLSYRNLQVDKVILASPLTDQIAQPIDWFYINSLDLTPAWSTQNTKFFVPNDPISYTTL